MKINALNIFAALGLVTLMACNRSGEIADTPTSGHITVSADESFKPIIESQVNTFEGIYKYAQIDPSYKSEGAVFDDLTKDSTRIAVVARELTPQEKAIFDKRKIIPRITKIAIDAVALIVNNDNPDSLLTLDQVKAIFSGKVKSWQELNKASSLKDITIVFDNNNSSTSRYVRDSLAADHKLPSNTFASNSHEALIDYVSQNKNALGVIGVNWISDLDDSTAVGFLDKVKVMGISKEPNPTSTESYYQPYQAYIAQGTYPLLRFIYIISTEGRAGLGTGFASFVAGDKGQRIFLKSGLVPATMPIRVIGLSN
ncbi:PstS family phosphate ABC transporter substrate-binding protein [Pontibacter liquoris]|uniref:PstS family phosphate ABC transporter substrate-binding protein n=1 Tax=Pontibacter liquoris TaxID=2905677 RepID=UPI001FA7F618|nr:substrate-binding domain-containing protein [Pontibacter liquoris]